MKTQEEIEQLAQDILEKHIGLNAELGYLPVRREVVIDAIKEAFTQCQEDMTELFKAEIKRAFIHGQGNAQAMEAGLEKDETEDYVNYRMLSLTKNK